MARTYNWSWPPKGVRPEAWKATETICKEAIKRSGTTTCSCAFSTGKDSLAMMIALHHFFETVVPVFWYHVPNLGFIERSLEYYERVFKTQTVRLPHPYRFYHFSYFQLQPPDRIAAMDWIMAEVPDFTMDSLFGEVRTQYGLDKLGGSKIGAMHATGIRAADSPIRASLYRKHGGFAPAGLLFYPVITWNLDDIEAALDHTGLMLPPEYRFIGRSFDGIMRRYTTPVKEHWPEDWVKILDDFPLADLEFFRAEKVTPPELLKPLYKFIGREGPKMSDTLRREETAHATDSTRPGDRPRRRRPDR